MRQTLQCHSKQRLKILLENSFPPMLCQMSSGIRSAKPFQYHFQNKDCSLEYDSVWTAKIS